MRSIRRQSFSAIFNKTNITETGMLTAESGGCGLPVILDLTGAFLLLQHFSGIVLYPRDLKASHYIVSVESSSSNFIIELSMIFPMVIH